MPAPRIAVLPSEPEIEQAVIEGGGTLAPETEAEAIVWVDPRDPEGLREALSRSPARWIQLPFAGIERFVAAGVIDPDRTWTCAKGIYGPATAEHGLGLILLAARSLHRHARTRTWIRNSDLSETRRLAGATVLVIGTGGIGTALAEMIAPLGVRILAANRSGKPMPGAERTVAMTGVKELLPEADFVFIAAPLTDETRGLIDADALSLMKPGAWIVNVARGALVDTDALVDALREDRIGGAALDVTDPEPLPDGHPLWQMDNVIVTSHAANTFAMAMPDLGALVKRNVQRFAAGEPLEGLVDVKLGY
ncbi:MAG TPA: D-isomer specific 2-hydroxyacid dehydrogenase family protein [Actinomycetota bacterium]|nr:D-isomer specific 2-hydroxyacid dehydrogenase family protein [Actinomycetota bacterium]